MAIMVFTAMIGSAVILAAMIIRMVPIKDSGKGAAGVTVTRSADGSVLGEVLVKFTAGSTQLTRTKAVQAALQKPVKVTTLSTVKKRSGLRTVFQTVESVSQKIATLRSIAPVIQPAVKLTGFGFETRAKRGTPSDVAATADALKQWYVVKVDPPTADLGQITAALRKQSDVLQVETNRRANVAATRSLSSTTSGAAVNLSDAQKAATVTPGDINLDGVVDGKDLRLLVNYLTSTGVQPKSLAGADVNRDGGVDIADLTSLVVTLTNLFRIQASDLTGDGVVNGDDVNFLANYLTLKGPAPKPLSTADYDADGNVDISDLTWLVDLVYINPSTAELDYGKGDANRDGVVDMRDLDLLIDYLIGAGPAPSPLGLVDMDLDSAVDITDLTLLISQLYGIGTVRTAALTSTSSTSSGSVTAPDGDFVVPTVEPTYILGDSNADGRVTLSDLHYLVQYLIAAGPAPSPLARADFDFDGVVDIYDLTVLVSQVYATLDAKLAQADFTGDGAVNKADVDYLVKYLISEGPAPDITKADIITDGIVDIADLTALIDYVYIRATPPVCEAVRTVGSTTILTGDVDGSGNLSKADLVRLAGHLYQKQAAPSPVERGDVDCDGATTVLDIAALKQLLETQALVQTQPDVLAGDANADGLVDQRDIAASITKYYSSGLEVDVNRDGESNFKDTYDLTRLLKLNVVKGSLPDLTGDGKVTWADADVILNATVKGQGTAPANADINGNGIIDVADGIAFVEGLADDQPITSVLAGDANADNLVDCRDAQALHAVYFKKATPPTPAARGDVNLDGVVNVADAILLAQRACPGTGTGVRPGDVTLALLDSGVQAVAADVKPILAPSKEKSLNKRDDDANGYIDDVVGYTTYTSGKPTVDCNGHGSALATVIAGRTGVASFARVIPVKVVDCKGQGTALGLMQGLVYATVRGADISVLPVSGVGTSKLLADAVAYAKANGMLVIGAAGNDGASISRVFPANVAGVLSVGATVANGRALAAYSNTGAAVVAPGLATGVKFEGTSVSSTYVAGTAALLLGKTPSLTLKQLESKLIPTPSKPNPKTLKLLDAAAAIAK